MTTKSGSGGETATSTEPTIILHTTTPPSLVARLAAIIGAIGPRTPQGENKFHKYKYFSDEQISEIFQKPLADAGIIIVPQVKSYQITENETKKGEKTFLTTIIVDYLITNGNESIVATGIGQGDDPGDKGANKAMTGAMKFMLLKLAQIGAGSDAEADEKTDQRANRGTVRVGDSNIQGIQRGGRSANATDAQVAKIRAQAKDLGLTAVAVAQVMDDFLGMKVELPEDEDPGPALVAFLERLSAEDIGRVIDALDRVGPDEAGRLDTEADDR